MTIYNYFSLNTMMQAMAVFIALKGTSVTKKIPAKLQHAVSDYSYGIYLVHIVIIGILYKNGIFWTMANPIISVPVVVIITLMVSWAIIFLLRKIPYGKYISG